MSKSILISIIILFLAVTNVAAQDAFNPFQGTSHAYKVNNHPGSSYNWGIYTQLNPMVSANPSSFSITGNGTSQITIQWNLVGDYYLLVTESDVSGCTNTKAMRITVQPNSFKVSFTNLVNSSCYKVNNDFSVPIQFKDINDLAMSASHFPAVVSFQVNGIVQSPQTITFANQNLAVSSSSFTANPNSDTPVIVTITGATDSNSLNVPAETISGQNIYNHKILQNLVQPTVEKLLTNDITPSLTGTVTLHPTELFTVLVNGYSYSPGDGNLNISGTKWNLGIPGSRPLSEGIHQVVATVSNSACSLTDDILNDLTIDITPPTVRPTVIPLLTNSSTPVITGTATVGNLEIFYVEVNGITYTPGDGNLSFAASKWSLQIPTYRAIPDGTYSVTARVTDQAGNSVLDNTSDELVVDTTPPAIPTVDRLVTNDTTPLIKGTAVLLTGEILKVNVNGKTYQSGDGKLSISGTIWSLQIQNGSEITDGTYPVTATITDAANNISTDATTDELIINTKAIIVSDRLATNDINVTFRNKPVSGNVLINDAGFYKFGPTVSVDYNPVNGSLTMDPQGIYTYTPNTGFIGTDNFYYTVCSTLDPADCDTMNVTIRVIPDLLADIHATAIDDEAQTLENTTVRGNVLANDLSVSGEKLILNLSAKEGPNSGTLVLNVDGSFVYTPKSGFIGTDYFVYEVCGEISGMCDHAKVTITVSNDLNEVRLFAADDAFFSLGKAIQGSLIANDLYPSASTLTVNRTPVVSPKNGIVSINANGTFNYTPTIGFVGTDQFVYEICDSQVGDCDYANVIVSVKEPPAQYADLSILKTGPETVNPGETVNYEVTVTNLGTASAINLQVNDYLPKAIENPKYTTSANSTSSNWLGYVDVATLDVNKTFSVFISGTVAMNAPDTLKNIATVISRTWDPNIDNNISTVKTKVHRDGPVAQIAGASYVAVGSCDTQGHIMDASGSVGDGLLFAWSPSVYLDNPSVAKPRFIPGTTTRYKLTVTDIHGQTDTASVLIIVPDAPKAVTDRNVYVDVPNKTILLNGSQSTGAGLSFLWQSQEGIILSGETTPSAQVSGLGMYYLQVTDSLGCINRDSVNVGLYIQAINDTVKTNVNEQVIINVIRNDKPAGTLNPSSISIVTPPLHGIAEVAADSLILYLPEDSYIGQDEFVYAICDYFMNCDQAKVLVLINDVPFFVPEAFSPNEDGINDKFEIKGLSKYKTVEIEIFNRWGSIIYQSKNYGEGSGKDGFWDGKAKAGLRVGSGPVPTGTYYYVMKLNGKETINGSIYLDR